jgi:serine/threonine protein kinase
MELCEGGDLFDYMKKRKNKLSEAKSCEITYKLLLIVYYLQSYGIAHRDLKPENIMMTDSSDDAQIKIVDFGLSTFMGPNEVCDDYLGTIVSLF